MSKMKDIMIKILNDQEFTGDTTKYWEKILKHIQNKKSNKNK